ncbi:MAG: glycosyltransferase family 2 protein, partial [Bacteroidetes bacterium]|nr:glycosyltransferase family 2 protein [Bacteroidota bacterium]
MSLEIDGPLVSVLMTAYNREQFIAEAIESVLASTYKNFELVIVDDCSSDNTVAIAKKYLKDGYPIRIYVNKKNLGDYPNRNKAVSFANGKYIMFCDSDDCFLENAIEYCVSNMEKNPEAKIGMYYEGEAGHPFLLDSSKALVRHFF